MKAALTKNKALSTCVLVKIHLKFKLFESFGIYVGEG